MSQRIVKASYIIFLVALVTSSLLFINHTLFLRSDASLQENQRRGGTYRIAIHTRPTTLDPIRSDWPISMQILHAMHATLVRVDANGDIVPHLVKHWNIDASRKHYLFQIRDDVFFHNGRKLTVDDVIGSLQRTLNKESLFRDNLRMVIGYEDYQKGKSEHLEGLRKLNDHEFEILLEKPFEPLLSMLSSINFVILPIKELAENPQFFESPIGAGAFQWSSRSNDKEFILEAYESYFKGSPFLSAVTFSAVEHLNQTILDNDAADQIYSLRGETMPQMNDAYVQIPIHEMRTFVLSFNTSKPPFNDKKVREAFKYAFDLQNIHRLLAPYPNLQPTASYIPKGMVGFDPDIRTHEVDLGLARQLLRNSQMNARTAQTTVHFATRLPKPAGSAVVEEVRRTLERLGMNVVIDTAWGSLEADLSKGSTPNIFFISYAPNFPHTHFLLNYFHSASIGYTNGARFSNKEYDTLLDSVASLSDYGEQSKFFKKLNRFLLDEVAVIPIYSGSAHNGIFKKKIRGLEFPHANFPCPLLEKVWFDS